MTEFIEFCQEYGVYLLTFVCFVIEIIFIFIKRRPKTVDDFLYTLQEIRLRVPGVVAAVEVSGNGEAKRSAVINYLTKEFEKVLGRKITEKECVIVSDLISKDIEAVLSAPTKKEILSEK